MRNGRPPLNFIVRINTSTVLSESVYLAFSRLTQWIENLLTLPVGRVPTNRHMETFLILLWLIACCCSLTKMWKYIFPLFCPGFFSFNWLIKALIGLLFNLTLSKGDHSCTVWKEAGQRENHWNLPFIFILNTVKLLQMMAHSGAVCRWKSFLLPPLLCS